MRFKDRATASGSTAIATRLAAAKSTPRYTSDDRRQDVVAEGERCQIRTIFEPFVQQPQTSDRL
jgi:hypothetical protein